MWTAFIEFLTSAPVTAALGAVIMALAGAVGGQHPKIAALLSILAGLFGRKAVKKPPVGLFVLAALLLGAAGGRAADAPPPAGTVVRASDDGKLYVCGSDGKFRPYAAKRAGCICGTECKCQPGVCPQRCPVGPPRAIHPAVQPCPSCQGGVCPSPFAPLTPRRD